MTLTLSSRTSGRNVPTEASRKLHRTRATNSKTKCSCAGAQQRARVLLSRTGSSKRIFGNPRISAVSWD